MLLFLAVVSYAAGTPQLITKIIVENDLKEISAKRTTSLVDGYEWYPRKLSLIKPGRVSGATLPRPLQKSIHIVYNLEDGNGSVLGSCTLWVIVKKGWAGNYSWCTMRRVIIKYWALPYIYSNTIYFSFRKPK